MRHHPSIGFTSCCNSFSFHTLALVRTRKRWKVSLSCYAELLSAANPCRQVQHKTCMNLCDAKTKIYERRLRRPELGTQDKKSHKVVVCFSRSESAEAMGLMV